MENNLNSFENGREHQFLEKERQPQLYGNKRRPQFLKMEEDLKLF
jgi:hypothetical protein